MFWEAAESRRLLGIPWKFWSPEPALGCNYLERAVADKLNIVEVLDHIFAKEAKSNDTPLFENKFKTKKYHHGCFKP